MKIKISPALFVLLLVFVWQSPFHTVAQTPRGKPEVKVDLTIFDSYVGQYLDPELTDFTYSFFREGDKLYVQFPDQPKYEIVPLSETRFSVKDSDAQLEFVKDSGGRAVLMIWRQHGGERSAKKLSDQPAKDTRVPYKRMEVMIPARDGVKLFTVILMPENETEKLPIILSRTPYGITEWTSDRLNSVRSELAKEKYIFAFQDIRGKNRSEGEFVMMRPPRDKSDSKSIDESTDAFDTIDWLIKNLPENNGRVGIVGVSYPGWLASVALLDPHPSLKAVSPQAPMIDVWVGDDFFHNGAFRLSYSYEFVKSMESSSTGMEVDKDAYDWYLSFPTLSKITEMLSEKLPTWNAFVAHPNYDEFWQTRAARIYLTKATVPTLVVGGWWDQEDLFGPLALYRALEKNDNENRVYLVMGPWNHGGWNGRGRRLGQIDFGSDTGKYFRAEIQAPWLSYYLKGKGNLKQAEATIFQSGSNRWMTYPEYPPRRNMEERKLYLHASGKLSFERPSTTKGKQAFDSYISDPSNPVPYRRRPIDQSGWASWLASDQRFLGERGDVLKWQTEPITEDVTITGDIIARLCAASSGTDSDWVAKLIDVYPTEYPANPELAGYQLMIASEVLRGRYRKGFQHPQPLRSDQVNEYVIDLRGNDYVFRKGHRIMVQIQSSWFPLYDRNPQKFVRNIFLAKESDFQRATQRIYRSAQHPSHISLSIAIR